jgi:ABC-type microcin C transport system permease subunit YejB
MKDDFRKITHGALARTDGLSDRAILWGMIFAVLVVVAGMIRGLVG